MSLIEKKWQNNYSNLEQRVGYLFLSKSLSDVTFIVGKDPDCQSFSGHRFVLAISSPVFYAMFFGSLASDKKEIVLDDEDPEAFKEILSHVYTNESKITDENVFKIIYSAKKYELVHLEDECGEFLYRSINDKNVVIIYSQVTCLH